VVARPRITPALNRQLREHPPSPAQTATIALAKQLAARLDAIDLDRQPAQAASLSRCLARCLIGLAPAVASFQDGQLGQLLQLLQTEEGP
jgi:hypothetical protein